MESLEPLRFAFRGNAADSRLHEEFQKGRNFNMPDGLTHGGDTVTITTSTTKIEGVAAEIDVDVQSVRTAAGGVETSGALQGNAPAAFVAAFNDWTTKQDISTKAIKDMSAVLVQFVGDLLETDTAAVRAYGIMAG
jgi:hypothetical protein